MTLYVAIKTLHILSATVLFGAGLGTAFQMWTAHRSGSVQAVAAVSRHVVLADFIFTTPAVIIQPVSGLWLVHLTGVDPLAPWLLASYGLYVLAGVCWLPVVWLQIRISRLAAKARQQNVPLPSAYFRYMHLWFALGWPAFAAIIAIIYLMVAKPALW